MHLRYCARQASAAPRSSHSFACACRVTDQRYIARHNAARSDRRAAVSTGYSVEIFRDIRHAAVPAGRRFTLIDAAIRWHREQELSKLGRLPLGHTYGFDGSAPPLMRGGKVVPPTASVSVKEDTIVVLGQSVRLRSGRGRCASMHLLRTTPFHT